MVTATVTKVKMTRSVWLMVVLAFSAHNAYSQQAISGSISGSDAVGTIPSLSAASAPSASQNSQAFQITPRLTLIETWSDNVALARNANNQKQSGLITEVSPGIRINARSARLKAHLDYSLRGQFYTSPSGYSSTQNSLNSFGTLEALDNWLYVDFSGVIAQQAISAFGTQSTNSANLNNNNTETSTYRISPYIRGQIGGTVEYLLRYNASTTNASASVASDVELSEWSGQLQGSTYFQSLRWSVNISQQAAEYGLGRQTDSQRLFGMANYTLIPEFRVSLSAGQEKNNYASLEQETHMTHGYGFDWTPTGRTQISAFREKRFFGDGHRYTFSHRFPRSSIRYSDSRDVSVLPNQFASTGLGTIFDLFAELCKQEFAGTITDPVQLDLAANTCATNLIARTGISPTTQVTSSFLSTRATIQRRQELALAIQGVRNTLTVLFNRSESESTLANSTVSDDFAANNINSIRQKGISVTLSHRLTSQTNLNLTGSRQESLGTGNNTLKTTTTLYQAGLTTRLGAKTTGGLSIRRSEFDSTTSPYTENALVGTLSILF